MPNVPRVFNWIGSDEEKQYWDEPANWAEGEYPDQKEAIVVFSGSLRKDTTIYLRKDIHLGKLWLSEQDSITFDAEDSPNSEEDNGPRFYFETDNQFSPIFVDRNNRADHKARRWILHSCIFGQTHRALSLGRPLPDDVRVTTIHFDGVIGNYKDPERASLQVYGHLKFQLNNVNMFNGPVVAKDNGEIRVMKNGGIPDDTSITLENNGSIYAEEGVTIRASELNINRVSLEPGMYFSDELEPESLQSLVPQMLENVKDLQVTQVSNLKGKGLVLVGG
ncbi:MAG: hypothetical protein RPU39_08430 [Candidatus Sedimenticola sp. (ex Thyasira tokunagai)]